MGGHELPANLLRGCVEIGGALRLDENGLAFAGPDGEEVGIPYREIAEMRLGGRLGQDATRLDLLTTDGEAVTMLVVGRDRVVEAVMRRQGWSWTDGEHAAPSSDV